jgi:hypothetical protein
MIRLLLMQGFVGKLCRRPEREQFFRLPKTAKQAISVLSSMQPDAGRRKKGHSKPDRVFRHSLALVLLSLSGCGLSSSPLPTQAEPLEDMEVSRTWFEIPQDEPRRQELPLGVFTGIKVGDSRQTLEAQLAAPEGVLVTETVENSPAVAAGIEAGDILLEAAIDTNTPVSLSWPSDWYKVEQNATEDATIGILYDRAGRDRETKLQPTKRISQPARLPGNHFREETKVGVIVRNASEVEADQAGLARGEGCVVVALARTSPWRKAGLLFGDMITGINDKPIKNPHELLAAINDLKKGDDVRIAVVRDKQEVSLVTTVSKRQQKVARFNIPLLFSYENTRGIQKTSVLFGLYGMRKTAVASQYTWFWLIRYTVGDANRLQETTP